MRFDNTAGGALGGLNKTVWKKTAGALSNVLARYTLGVALVLIMIVFGAIEPKFFSAGNIINVLRQSVNLGILGIALTTIVIVGEFDISFATIASFVSTLTIILANRISTPAAILMSLAAGTLVGALNGVLVVSISLPSFITTLGTMTVLSGLSLVVTQGKFQFAERFSEVFKFLGNGLIVGVIPIQIAILMIVVAFFYFLLEDNRLGWNMYSIGNNQEAALFCGIRIKRVKFFCFTMAGLLSAVVGVLIATRLNITNTTIGSGYLMPAIAAVFLGTLLIKDGLPNPIGTVVGAFLLSTINNGLILVGVSHFYTPIASGSILILALAVSSIRKTKALRIVKL